MSNSLTILVIIIILGILKTAIN